ncbi:hypothetical protein CR513_05582, partial [Mucuna pruriens]
MVKELELVEKFRDMNLYVERSKDHISCGMIMVTILVDPVLCRTKELLGMNKARDLSLGKGGILRCKRKDMHSTRPRAKETHFGRRLEEDVLVVKYEKGSGRVRGCLPNLSKSQSRTSKAQQVVVDNRDT